MNHAIVFKQEEYQFDKDSLTGIMPVVGSSTLEIKMMRQYLQGRVLARTRRTTRSDESPNGLEGRRKNRGFRG